MVKAMALFPEIPLERTYAVLDDMERRWRANGYSMHAVYAYRQIVAAHIGDQPAGRRTGWTNGRRRRATGLSDCVGCDPTEKSAWLVAVGRDDEVIALAEPVLAGTSTCHEQPRMILTALLLPYLRTGRLDDARDAHRRAYRLHRDILADLPQIAQHIEFCARTGNETRGLELVERHLPWLDTASTPFDAMMFAAAAGLTLRRLSDAGHGAKVVYRTAYGDRPEGDVTVAALADDLSAVALGLAGRFDERNGTDYQTTIIAQLLAAEPIVDYLPLSDTARKAAAVRPVDPVPAAPLPPLPVEASADELLDLVEEHLRWDRLAQATAVEDVFDDRFAAAELSPVQRGRRADLRGLIAANNGDDGVAEIAWSSALDLYTAAGDEFRRQSARARLGQLLCKTDRNEIGLPIVQDATDYLIAHGPAAKHCGAYRRLAFVFMANGRLDDAFAALDQAVIAVDVSDDPYAAIRVQVDRAGMLGRAGRLDEADPVATAAREASRAAGYQIGVAAASWLLGNVAQSRNDLATAVACYDEALTAVDNPNFAREIRRQRAAMLAGTGRSREAIDDLAEEVARATAEGNVPLGMTARYHLANAYINAARPLDAADVLEEMLTTIPADDPAAESVRHMLSQAYQMLDQPDQAIEQLELISASGTNRGSTALVGEMNEQIAQILDRLDRDSVAAVRFAASMQAYRQADMVREAVRAGRRAATSHMYADEMPQAVEALDAVDRVALDLDDQDPKSRWERAMLFVDGARIVEQSGDVTTAIFRCAPAITMLNTLGDASTATFATLTYGEMLVRAGRSVEAEPALRSVLAGERENLKPRAASALARALDDLGRANEAAEIRAKLDRDQ